MSAATAPAVGATDVGRVRDNNEDAFAVSDDVWVVADGLGGHAGGEVASTAAVRAAVEQLEKNRSDAPAETLRAAFAAAHDAILRAAEIEPSLADMGTTLVLAYRDGDGQVHVGNVGDSRAYCLADGALQPITVDDNHAQELVDAGALTPEQARSHPGRFWLSKSLGLGDPTAPEPRCHVVPQSAERLLLCSDGLNSEIDDERIAALLSDGAPADTAQRLVQAALDTGGRDNVTVVVVDLAPVG